MACKFVILKSLIKKLTSSFVDLVPNFKRLMFVHCPFLQRFCFVVFRVEGNHSRIYSCNTFATLVFDKLYCLRVEHDPFIAALLLQYILLWNPENNSWWHSHWIRCSRNSLQKTGLKIVSIPSQVFRFKVYFRKIVLISLLNYIFVNARFLTYPP